MEDLFDTLGKALIIINSANWAWKFAKWFWKLFKPVKKSIKKKRKK